MEKAASLTYPTGGPQVDESLLLRCLTSFEEESEELYKIESRLQRFNLFDVLRSADTEIRHSNVLAWLLNPKENHGFGDAFLRRWLVGVFRQCQDPNAIYLDPAAVEDASFSSVTVRREWEHLDIFIDIKTQDGSQWVICVENKIRANQYVGQLACYRKVVQQRYAPPVRHAFIFLTRRGEEPEDRAFVSTNYDTISKALEKCLAHCESRIDKDARFFVQQYLELLKERFMDTTPVAQLARKIYAQHRKALDLILEHRPDSRAALTEAVCQHLQAEAAELKIVPLRVDKWGLRFIPMNWDVENNRIPDARDWRHVFCQIELRKPFPVIIATVYPSEQMRFAKAITTLAQKSSFPKEGNKSSIESSWYSFYVRQGQPLGLDDISGDDSGTLASEIWRWVKGEIRSKAFRTMRDEVRKLLPKLS